ncbi:hypothetical protein R1sor_013928 [Riccia sorocarpa]|uniref:DDE Tnp4 domain-containing protein n=1 Tax=Riccia sorocarpa TaxID=122646 RepID=A0ABD3HE62_9MARC
MGNFSESFVSCEKKKQKWTERHFQWLVEAEERREAKKAMRSDAIVDEELILLLMMMAVSLLLVQIILEEDANSDSDEDELMAEDHSRFSESKVDHWAFVIYFACSLMGTFCLHQGLWWVTERCLLWHDYFLMGAYEESRWRACVGVPRDTFEWMEHMPEVIDAVISVLGPEFLRWPDPQELLRISAAFQRHSGLPNVSGAIDGSHIRIRFPRWAEHARDFFNRKSHHSIVLQGICDPDGAFLDVSCGAPGSVHDTRCLRLSSFHQRAESGAVLQEPVISIN